MLQLKLAKYSRRTNYNVALNYRVRWPETKVLGIKRLLQVDTKASPLLKPLVVAATTTDASKLEITARSSLIEPGHILIF
jgi:hypothetical protein